MFFVPPFTISGVNRTRDPGKCPNCHQEPKLDEHGRYVCDCKGIYWAFKAGVVGSPDEKELLRKKGWQLVELSQIIKRSLDVYWVGPHGNILLLHDDGTWYCDTAPRRFQKLEDFLAWHAEHMEDSGSVTQ